MSEKKKYSLDVLNSYCQKGIWDYDESTRKQILELIADYKILTELAEAAKKHLWAHVATKQAQFNTTKLLAEKVKQAEQKGLL